MRRLWLVAALIWVSGPLYAQGRPEPKLVEEGPGVDWGAAWLAFPLLFVFIFVLWKYGGPEESGS